MPPDGAGTTSPTAPKSPKNASPDRGGDPVAQLRRDLQSAIVMYGGPHPSVEELRSKRRAHAASDFPKTLSPMTCSIASTVSPTTTLGAFSYSSTLAPSPISSPGATTTTGGAATGSSGAGTALVGFPPPTGESSAPGSRPTSASNLQRQQSEADLSPKSVSPQGKRYPELKNLSPEDILALKMCYNRCLSKFDMDNLSTRVSVAHFIRLLTKAGSLNPVLLKAVKIYEKRMGRAMLWSFGVECLCNGDGLLVQTELTVFNG